MATVIINSDKTINVNGIKTFPVGIYGVFYNSPFPSLLQPNKTQDFLFRCPSQRFQYWVQPPENYLSVVDSFVKNGQYLFALGSMASNYSVRNSSGLFGYYLFDEPNIPGLADAKTPAETKVYYDAIKANDPNHPVVLNLDCCRHGSDSQLRRYASAADILAFDDYVVRNNNDIHLSDSSATYKRNQVEYAYEYRANLNAFYNGDPSTYSKPIWIVVQAEGGVYTLSMLQPLTAQEIRTMSYLAITMNVNGIVYYTFWENWGSPDNGLGSYPSELLLYQNQAREFKNINYILVMPTLGYQWQGHLDSTHVQFSGTGLTTNFVYGIGQTITTPKLNYILKGDSTGTYLIVLNKDSSAINGVTVTIPSLSSVTEQISILGIAGESARTLSMANGKFIDNFAAKAVHVYRLSGAPLPPPPTPPPIEPPVKRTDEEVILVVIATLSFLR